jgi:hypothetical protein
VQLNDPLALPALKQGEGGQFRKLRLSTFHNPMKRRKGKKERKNKRTTEQSASRLSKRKTDSHGPVITVTAQWSFTVS